MSTEQGNSSNKRDQMLPLRLKGNRTQNGFCGNGEGKRWVLGIVGVTMTMQQWLTFTAPSFRRRRSTQAGKREKKKKEERETKDVFLSTETRKV